MHDEIYDWLKDSLDAVAVQHPVSVHIDDLLRNRPIEQEIVNISMKAFLTLNELLRQKHTNVFPLLVIPLRPIGNRLSLVLPDNLDALIDELGDEPPSLYLLSRRLLEHAEFCEEYKHPLSFDLITPSPDGIYVYYREFRNRQALINRWEYSRCVYVQPDPLFG